MILESVITDFLNERLVSLKLGRKKGFYLDLKISLRIRTNEWSYVTEDLNSKGYQSLSSMY